jgi:hypothetical protein
VVTVLLRKGERRRKITAVVIAVIVAGALLLVLYRPVTLTVGPEGVTTSGINSIDLSWNEISQAYLESNLPRSEYRPTVRTRGAAIGQYRTGRFLLSNGDSARVFMERSDAAVILVTADLTYLLAPEDVEGLAEAVDRFYTRAER